MAVSIDWLTKIISVPKADLILIQTVPQEIRELDLNVFRLELKNLEDDSEGMPFLDTHRHNTEVILGGITYARVVEIINGYTITFEDGQYSVNLTRANSNVADKVNVNQVSIRASNSAGLISSSLIEHSAFNGVVIIDSIHGVPGILFPIGTHKKPVNNLTDALIICANNHIDKLMIHTDLTIEAGHDVSGMAIETHGMVGTDVTLENGCSADKTAFRYLNLQGSISNGDTLLVENCSINNLTDFTGVMNNCVFNQGSEISINLWAEIMNCQGGGEVGNEPEINIGDSILHIQKYSGNVKFTYKTGDNKTVLSGLPANIIIASSCVNGTIQLLGVGQVEHDDSSDDCKVDIDSLISNANIADAVLDEQIYEHVADGSLGYVINTINNDLKRVLGLMHHNIFIDNPVYDSSNNLVSARIRIYSNAVSVGTNNNVIGTYEMTADTSAGIAGQFTNWQQIAV